ncbi:unnamed protein product [Cuscuta epithymum]|uniref:Uncharacterized protein n=1 Tax=Cuscuta epithymum TaxID=186058 RepID=A0AAV0C1K4_9ASTE|nr:unnamed protein product [Cuscuta epithymum]
MISSPLIFIGDRFSISHIHRRPIIYLLPSSLISVFHLSCACDCHELLYMNFHMSQSEIMKSIMFSTWMICNGLTKKGTYQVIKMNHSSSMNAMCGVENVECNNRHLIMEQLWCIWKKKCISFYNNVHFCL